MKKTEKAVKIILICIVLLFCFGICAGAENSSDDLISESPAGELFDRLPDETKELFEEAGISSLSFDSIFSVNSGDIAAMFGKLVTGQIEAPVKSFIRLMSVIVMLSVAECFMPDNDGMKNVAEIVGTLFCVISVISPLTTAISAAAASITLSAGFMAALIPVLAAVVTASGNPVLALSFQSIAFSAAQVISAVSKNCIMPLVGAVLAIDITGAIMPSFNLSGLTEFIKKTLTAVMSFAATMFVSFLGIKEALANAADTVASSGIKLAISTAVPVVGGALSEAYSGVMGSLVLARSTVGIFGIAAIALINLPSCVQLVFWIFALRAGAAAGEIFDRGGTAELLKSMASAVTLLNVVLVFNAVLFIISTALIITIKAM